MKPLTRKPHAGGHRAPSSTKAGGPCEAQDTARVHAAQYLAQVAVDAARMQLDTCATLTSDPPAGLVEAADLLDLVADKLATLDATLGEQSP